MRINIVIDVDVRESGFSSEDEIKDNIVDFTRDLLNNGAENQGIGYSYVKLIIMEYINDKWTYIHQRIISLTILFQELTGIIYKASSEN